MSAAKQKTSAVPLDVYASVCAIFDERSFVETDKLITSTTVSGEAIGEGAVCGFATISDVRVATFLTNPSVLKGSIGAKNAEKIVKTIYNAISADVPVIGIFDTQGARINEGIEALEGYGKIVKALSDAYGTVPTVCVIKGKNYGISAYLSAVCDLCVAYDKAQIATASPLVLASNTKLDALDIGTTAVHSAETGVITNVVKTDAELKKLLSQFLSYIVEPEIDATDDANRSCALKGGESIDKIIATVFDKGSFFGVRSNYALQVVTGYARLNGKAVGVVAVKDKLTPSGAVKITEFINTCETFGIPIVNLVDCVGAIEDYDAERCCLIREVSNLLFTVSQTGVSKVSLIYGSAIGLGYVAFASKSIYDYVIAWNTAKINSISDVKAAQLIYADEIALAKDKDKMVNKLAESYSLENSTATVVAQKGYLDNVISPAHTRQYLISAVSTFCK